MKKVVLVLALAVGLVSCGGSTGTMEEKEVTISTEVAVEATDSAVVEVVAETDSTVCDPKACDPKACDSTATE